MLASAWPCSFFRHRSFASLKLKRGGIGYRKPARAKPELSGTSFFAFAFVDRAEEKNRVGRQRFDGAGDQMNFCSRFIEHFEGKKPSGVLKVALG